MLRVTVEKVWRGFTLAAAFEGPTPGITVLFGPSGSGKSSILGAMAGLWRPDFADVDLSGERISRLAPHRRGIGMVFQDGRLFPHLSVRGNLEYGLHRARGARRIVPQDVVALLGLEPLLHRRPAALSGGERQRVAIGRALLAQPRLLLMDEPLASLDAARRAEILPYLARLRDTLDLPVVYVTHAYDELQRLADHVVLLQQGRVAAQGALSDMAARVDLPLAARDDAAAILRGYVHSHDAARRLSAIACGGQIFLVPLQPIEERRAVRLRVPARDVILTLDAPRAISVNNIVPGVVCAVGQDESGHAALVELDIGGGQLLARVTLDAAERLHLEPGRRVNALIKSMVVEVI